MLWPPTTAMKLRLAAFLRDAFPGLHFNVFPRRTIKSFWKCFRQARICQTSKWTTSWRSSTQTRVEQLVWMSFMLFYAFTIRPPRPCGGRRCLDQRGWGWMVWIQNTHKPQDRTHSAFNDLMRHFWWLMSRTTSFLVRWPCRHLKASFPPLTRCEISSIVTLGLRTDGESIWNLLALHMRLGRLVLHSHQVWHEIDRFEFLSLIWVWPDGIAKVVISYDWHPHEHCSFVESANAGKVAMKETE